MSLNCVKSRQVKIKSYSKIVLIYANYANCASESASYITIFYVNLDKNLKPLLPSYFRTVRTIFLKIKC